MLIVNIKIKKNVNRFIHSFKSINFLGIQIRAGNDDLHERKISDEKDIEIMLNIAKSNKEYKIWYLTGDSQQYKRKLCKEYRKIKIYSNNKAKHYAKYTTDFTIIIEHEILSKSKFIIISKSTYGLTAFLKSGLLLYSRNNNSYIVSNRTSYKIMNYILYNTW